MCLSAVAAVLTAPPRPRADGRVHLLHADELYYNQRVNREAQILVGNVRFRHDDVILTCDSALFFQADNTFDAFGHVRMNQADTLTLVSDVLYYDGTQQLAQARYNVVMSHHDSRLYCDSLNYDRIDNLGYFFNGGRLVDKENTLTSEWGQYSPATREAIFNYNVYLRNPQFTLVSDTLHYNTATGWARIVGPSNIDSGDNHIYSENGHYDTRAGRAYLLDRSIVSNQGASIEADSLCYQADSTLSKAFGNVVYIDRDNRNEFRGNYVLYSDSLGYAEAADSAVCIDYSQPDTFYIHADSFRVRTYYIDTDTMWRELRAYRHVRAFRRDVQAVCDSLVFHSLDSCITMYKDPILWQQGQQLLGEEIKAWLNDSTIDSTHVLRQALSVERIDSMCYNQVAGHVMRSYFSGGEMHTTVVDDNVRVNYFPFDSDSLMIGMVHAEGSLLTLYMAERRVRKIIFDGSTEGRMHPLALIPPAERYLDNFHWFDYIRPLSKDDIFVWRPKREGTALKPSVQHTPRRAAPPAALGTPVGADPRGNPSAATSPATATRGSASASKGPRQAARH